MFIVKICFEVHYFDFLTSINLLFLSQLLSIPLSSLFDKIKISKVIKYIFIPLFLITLVKRPHYFLILFKY
jgi:hypothetical protein